ncbi:MAG: DUF3500 domain-containing protein, partial [Acidimicrobiia bacterium]
VPGHREAGMEGVVAIDGDPITLAEAEAAGGTVEGGAPEGGAPAGETNDGTEAPPAGEDADR